MHKLNRVIRHIVDKTIGGLSKYKPAQRWASELFSERTNSRVRPSDAAALALLSPRPRRLLLTTTRLAPHRSNQLPLVLTSKCLYLYLNSCGKEILKLHPIWIMTNSTIQKLRGLCLMIWPSKVLFLEYQWKHFFSILSKHFGMSFHKSWTSLISEEWTDLVPETCVLRFGKLWVFKKFNTSYIHSFAYNLRSFCWKCSET